MNLPFTPSIDVITGPMYCGKTTEIMRRLVIYHEMDMRVLYVNTKLDTRTETAFSSHNKTIGAVPFDTLKVTDLKECDIRHYDVIAIDEAQFFDHLKDTILNWTEKEGKIVIVAGLNGDYQRKPFGELNDLFPYCDTITKLTPFCMLCKRNRGACQTISPAQFSKRLVASDEEVLIGGKDMYIPVCRKCYNS